MTAGPAWHLLAACQYTDPDAFFPDGDEGDAATADMADEARGVCIGCPVRAECFRYSMASGEQWGIWAGLSERQRRRERQHRPPRPAAEVFTAADARWHRRQALRLAFWEHEAVVAAMHRKAEEAESLAA